jgi:hypothetical protein
MKTTDKNLRLELLNEFVGFLWLNAVARIDKDGQRQDLNKIPDSRISDMNRSLYNSTY